MQDNSAWLDGLKPGAKVAEDTAQFSAKTQYVIRIVEKVTKNFIVLKPRYKHQTRGEKFRRATGYSQDGGLGATRIVPLTAAVKTEIERGRLFRALDDFPFSHLELPALRAISQIITREKAKLDIAAAGPEPEENKDVHTEHCCLIHGCKYGDETCPVVTKKKRQSFPCESCASDYNE